MAALPGQALAEPETSLVHRLVETGLAGEVDRLQGVRLLGAVLAVVELPAAASDQQPHAATGVHVGDDGFHRVEHGQDLLLRRAVADPVEHPLSSQQQVETEQRRRRRERARSLGRAADWRRRVREPRPPARRRPDTNAPPPHDHRRWVVVGDQPGVLVGALRALGHPLEPAGGEPVVVPAVAAQHPLVGHVAQQGVLEQELRVWSNADFSRWYTTSRPRNRSRASTVVDIDLVRATWSPAIRSVSTASSQKTRPMTEARCSASRSRSAARRGGPAARSAGWREPRPGRGAPR